MRNARPTMPQQQRAPAPFGISLNTGPAGRDIPADSPANIPRHGRHGRRGESQAPRAGFQPISEEEGVLEQLIKAQKRAQEARKITGNSSDTTWRTGDDMGFAMDGAPLPPSPPKPAHNDTKWRATTNDPLEALLKPQQPPGGADHNINFNNHGSLSARQGRGPIRRLTKELLDDRPFSLDGSAIPHRPVVNVPDTSWRLGTEDAPLGHNGIFGPSDGMNCYERNRAHAKPDNASEWRIGDTKGFDPHPKQQVPIVDARWRGGRSAAYSWAVGPPAERVGERPF